MFKSVFSALMVLASATLATAQTDATEETPAETGTETGTETAGAQPVANGQTFGAWTVNCEAVAVGQTACLLTQTILRDTDRAFLAQVVAVTNGQDGKTYLLARVPLGVSLPFGLAMRPEGTEDEESLIRFGWQTCLGQVCEALAEVDADRLAAVDAEGVTMLASYQPGLKSEPVVFRMSLQGMGAGLAAIAPPPQ